MADIVAPVVLESMIKLITHEANMLSGVKYQVNLLKDDLGVMNAFLKDSTGKQHSNHVVKEIVDQISNVALEAEDVIDTYMAKVMKQGRRNPVSKLFHLPGRAKTIHQVATKTAIIKSRINNIYANIATYGIGEAESSGGAAAEAGQPFQKMRRKVEEDDVVGFIHTQKLVSQLTDTTKKSKRDVVSIVGMGGLGKTTLAKKIYNNTHVKNHFGCRAWVNVSQEYKTRNLFLDILKSFNLPKFGEIYKMDDEDLEMTLCNYLKGKKYFIVMDDIWSIKVWEEIRDVFPDELNGSRILITSRQKEVALHASPTTDPYFLPFLSNDESWELLRKKVFQGEECPFNLESLGMELAKRCKGLPLSIVVLGGILAKKDKSTQIWSKVIGCVTSYLTDERTPCLEILALSYNHLPLELKPCFLYLGMFPEDYEIGTRDLIKLWVSERFVHPIGNRKVIDVAEDYLEELIDRSLIQVARRGSDGSVERCRIHDLLRDLCIKVSHQEKFFDVHSEANNLPSQVKPRRLSINCDSTRYIISENACDTSSARSLLFFCQDGDFLEKQWEWICKGFKFIRALRLFNVDQASSIPKEIEKLIFLRHLSISSYTTEHIFSGDKVPDYICSLPYLETLELQLGNYVSISQKSISRMKHLRYVDVGREFRILADGQSERGRSVDMRTLPNLQSIQTILLDRHTASILPMFPNLTELSLFDRPYLAKSDSEEALESLKKNLRNLRRLDLRNFRDCHLQGLPSTLTKVNLNDSAGPNMMKTLAKLPNLLHLQIQHTEYLDLNVVAGEFPQLQVFQLIDSTINSWEMEGDGMQNLMRLIITNRYKESIRVPEQLWFLRALRFVKMEIDINLANSFRNKLWKLNCVKEETEDEFKSYWELTLKNGCKVSLSR